MAFQKLSDLSVPGYFPYTISYIIPYTIYHSVLVIYSENSENFYHDEKYRRRIFSVTNNSKNSKSDSSAKQAVSTSMDDLLVLRTQEARHSLVARHMRNSISSVKSSSELAIEELVGSYLICSLAIILYQTYMIYACIVLNSIFKTNSFIVN